MAVVSPDFFDPEGEFLDDIIDEVDSIGLRAAFIYFKSPHSDCIVDGCILEPACLLTGFSYESQELDVHLDVMGGDLFVISFGMNFAGVYRNLNLLGVSDRKVSLVAGGRHHHILASRDVDQKHRFDLLFNAYDTETYWNQRRAIFVALDL